jgi:uncharacterized DUF497 family protein
MYYYGPVNIEWDPKKALANFQKHSVSFDEAYTVLTQVGTVILFENHPKEDRWLAIGFSTSANLLVVIYCERGENTLRIISARKATRKERDHYEEGI